MIHGKYVEIEPVITEQLNKNNIHVFYFCGGRGIGKTYGGMDYLYRIGTHKVILDETGKADKFLYLRTTEVEAASIANPAMNPFKKYNSNEGTNVRGEFNRSLGVGYFLEDDNHLGYAAALSTFQNLRGVDFSDVCIIFYDEIIPESKKKRNSVSNPGHLLLNVIETINRNRALDGETEVVVVMLSNPIDLGAPILSELGFTQIIDEMMFKRQNRYTDKSRSLHISRYENHKVSLEKEKKSMLYAFAKDLNFNEQAIQGKFTNNDMDCIAKNVPLTEYKPVFTIENICVYENKGNPDQWYISRKMSVCRYNYKVYNRDFLKEMGFYWKYKRLVAYGLVKYDNYQTRTTFNTYIGFKADF